MKMHKKLRRALIRLKLIWNYRRPTDAEMDWHIEPVLLDGVHVGSRLEIPVAVGTALEMRCVDRGRWWLGNDRWQRRLPNRPETTCEIW